MAQERVYRWRRLDGASLEVARLLEAADKVSVRGTAVVAAKDAFVVDYDWRLDGKWRTTTLSIEVRQRETRALTIDRVAFQDGRCGRSR